MMIVIPVLIILLITMGILVGILTDAGSSVTIAAASKWAETTNYQLQLMVDSLNEDLVENKDAFREGSSFLEICSELEQIGVKLRFRMKRTSAMCRPAHPMKSLTRRPARSMRPARLQLCTHAGGLPAAL